jgi:hypothetical protein
MNIQPITNALSAIAFGAFLASPLLAQQTVDERIEAIGKSWSVSRATHEGEFEKASTSQALTRYLYDRASRLAREAAAKQLAANPPAEGFSCESISILITRDLLTPSQWTRFVQIVKKDLHSDDGVDHYQALAALQQLDQATSFGSPDRPADPVLSKTDAQTIRECIAVLSTSSDSTRVRDLAARSLSLRIFASAPLEDRVRDILAAAHSPTPPKPLQTVHALSGLLIEVPWKDESPAGAQTEPLAAFLLKVGAADDRQSSGMAIGLLGRLGKHSSNYVPQLRQWLRTGSRMQRFGVQQAVDAMGPRASELAPDVIDALSSTDQTLRRPALRMIAAIGPTAAAGVPKLIEVLDEVDPDQAFLVARALMHFGPLAAMAIERLEAEVAKDPEAFDGYAKVALSVIRDHEPIAAQHRFPWEN